MMNNDLLFFFGLWKEEKACRRAADLDINCASLFMLSKAMNTQIMVDCRNNFKKYPNDLAIFKAHSNHKPSAKGLKSFPS